MPEFTVAQILSVYQDRLYCTFAEQRQLLDHMAGRRVELWNIPTAIKPAQASLARQFPWLKRIGTSGPYRGDVHARQVRESEKYAGAETVAVRPLRSGTYTPRKLEDIL